MSSQKEKKNVNFTRKAETFKTEDIENTAGKQVRGKVNKKKNAALKLSPLGNFSNKVSTGKMQEKLYLKMAFVEFNL